MKYVKTLGLVAFVAISLMALTAVSASATIIENGSGQLPKGTAIDTSLTSSANTIWRVGSFILDECSGGTIEALTSNNGGSTETVGATVTKGDLTWSGCSRTTATLAGGELEIHWTSGSNGTLTAKGFEITINTIFGDCEYGFGATARDLGEIQGGTPATIGISANVPKITGPCPGTEATWTAIYTVTSPSTLRVTTS